MNRRQFLTALAATTLVVPITSLASTKRLINADNSRYYSARASQDGRYFISGFNTNGKLNFDTQLPGRGHGLALNPNAHHLAVAARRPGSFLLILNSETGEILHRLESNIDRHFYGHSIYSDDGRWLFTTENDLENNRGVIGVRDVNKGYQHVVELDAYGIGPHELNMLSDGRTLVVANGGILTRPETGRTKLNLDTMSPSLTYIDAENGELLEQLTLPKALHKNSIRHFAVNKHDQVCFAMQYQGDANDLPQLIGLHQRGDNVQLLQAPEATLKQMHNYCGSVCADASGHWFAVSSPKGNLVTFWSAREGKYVGSVEVSDGCGIAASQDNGEFLLSSGMGGVYAYRVGDGQLKPLAEMSDSNGHWDNHMASISF